MRVLFRDECDSQGVPLTDVPFDKLDSVVPTLEHYGFYLSDGITQDDPHQFVTQFEQDDEGVAFVVILTTT